MDALAAADISLFNGFRLDRRAGVLFQRDQQGVFTPIAIGRRGLDILRVLVERPGDLISRDEIIDAVWPGTTVEDSNLNVQIAALRRLLDDGRPEGSCIQTVSGRGYRFVAPVTRVEPAVPPTSSPISGNGSGTHIAEDEEPRGPDVPSRSGSLPLLPTLRARYRLWAGIMVMAVSVLVLIAALAAWNWDPSPSTEAPSAPRLSIVVLPFTNLNNDPEQQYFIDAVTDDLTTDLSRIGGLLVISRNTAFTYKDKPVDTKQIGRELGVRYVLEGSVRRLGDQLRVNAQLIDAETNAHLWAERFDRDAGDLFALQDEIARRIAVALGQELVIAEAARPTERPDALDHILRGRAVRLKPPSRQNYDEAIDLFERALALDPKSARAQSALAISLTARALDGLSGSRASDIARAETLAVQALAAAPRSPAAHHAKGQVLRAQNRCAEAIPEYETVVAFNRNWAAAYAHIGRCKLAIGLIEEAIPLYERALRLSPRDPDSGNWYLRIGIVHLLQSRTNEAIVWLEKARCATPELPDPYAALASAYALQGGTERAAASLAEARQLNPDGRYASIARLRTTFSWSPTLVALRESTYLAGLRKAGMPEE